MAGLADHVVIVAGSGDGQVMADVATDGGRAGGIAVAAVTSGTSFGQTAWAAVNVHGMDADLMTAGIAGVAQETVIVMGLGAGNGAVGRIAVAIGAAVAGESSTIPVRGGSINQVGGVTVTVTVGCRTTDTDLGSPDCSAIDHVKSIGSSSILGTQRTDHTTRTWVGLAQGHIDGSVHMICYIKRMAAGTAEVVFGGCGPVGCIVVHGRCCSGADMLGMRAACQQNCQGVASQATDWRFGTPGGSGGIEVAGYIAALAICRTRRFGHRSSLSGIGSADSGRETVEFYINSTIYMCVGIYNGHSTYCSGMAFGARNNITGQIKMLSMTTTIHYCAASIVGPMTAGAVAGKGAPPRWYGIGGEVAHRPLTIAMAVNICTGSKDIGLAGEIIV